MAIHLPIRVVGYSLLQNSIECGEELTSYGYKNVHLRFTFDNSTLKVSSIPGYGSRSNY